MDRRRSLETALRAGWPAALARMVRVTGSLHEAEDCLQDAAASAIEAWDRDGIPDSPGAWLIAAARNRYFDDLRHRRVARTHAHLMIEPTNDAGELTSAAAGGALEHDDLLRLVFICCHSALPKAARLLLTLRAIAGLTVAEIGRALLIEERTAEKRLTRAKQLVQAHELTFEVPGEQELAARLGSVLHVVYLTFNEGYKATSGDALIRVELCRVAIGLARTLTTLFPAEPEVLGLLALMVLTHSRSAARFSHSGEIVLLDRQDRSLWDREAIVEGEALIEKAMRHRRPGPYQLEAAIAALHCAAGAADQTDWPQIARLYEALERMRPSPVVTLNRAVAVANAEGPRRGLELLDSLAGRRELEGYPEFHGARGVLLERLGDPAAAIMAYRRARVLTRNAPTARHLEGRIDSALAAIPA